MTQYRNYDQLRYEMLQNFDDCLAYLRLSLQEGGLEQFLEAFGHVVKAQGGVQAFASKTHLTRQTIYNALKRKDLYASSLWHLMEALGLRFDLVPSERKGSSLRRLRASRRRAFAI